MMHFSPALFTFLKDLAAHNDKAWLDAHRARYQAQRQEVIAFTEALYDQLATVDTMPWQDPKKSVARINNNRKFHPDKPPYKDHFGIMVNRGPGKAGLYLHIHPAAAFFGGGIYRPARDIRAAIRAQIDERGAELRAALQTEAFRDRFGTLQGDQLKVAPRDYPRDHPHVDLLRYQDFVFSRPLSQRQLRSPQLLEALSADFAAALPFLQFLDTALAES